MPRPKTILVAVDFSDCSTTALDYACELAQQLSARLCLLHVLTRIGDGSADEPEQIRLALEKLNSIISAREELAIQTTKDVLSGVSAQRIIVDYARKNEVDLIVMGTHGRRGLARFALGSVAERVLRDAPCPVTVLQSGDSTATLLDKAIDSLKSQFGDSITGNRDDSIKTIHEHIMTSLQTTETTANRLIDELQSREWMQWNPPEQGHPGNFEFVTGVEFVELPGQIASGNSDSPAIDLINRASRLRATDIHFDPKSDSEYSVRFRIDGKLESYCSMSTDVATHLINRFKTLARLDIADPFTPKESRLMLPASMKDLEVRCTTAPVAGGEAVALRLFTLGNVFLPLDELGHSEASLVSVDAMLRRGEGLVLVTGPTGSGKSTTVYSMLQSLACGERNIVSIEDPVEFSTPFIRQMNVDPKHGITLSSGMRTLLRMDPDVLFVGEIRDAEAAQIAMHAASSGHYVFSTLHTRDVASTITALRDLGITDRSLSGNMAGIVNQRLVRRLCSDCRYEVEVTEKQLAKFELHTIAAPPHLYRSKGCNSCRNTGYKGRAGVFEAAQFNADIAAAVADSASEHHIREVLHNGGIADLVSDALQKAAQGTTDFDEAMGIRWL